MQCSRGRVTFSDVECLTWHRSVGSIEACSLYYAICDKVNSQEVSGRYEIGRNGVSTKRPNQRKMNVVSIVHLPTENNKSIVGTVLH